MDEKHFLMPSARGCLLDETKKIFPLAREDEVTRFLMRKALVKGVALCLAVHVANFRFDHGKKFVKWQPVAAGLFNVNTREILLELYLAGLDADPDVPATGMTTGSQDSVQEGNRN
ncbi:hypothetical protein ACLKA7_011541 [Drosophila subpalustris]